MVSAHSERQRILRRLMRLLVFVLMISTRGVVLHAKNVQRNIPKNK